MESFPCIFAGLLAFGLLLGFSPKMCSFLPTSKPSALESLLRLLPSQKESLIPQAGYFRFRSSCTPASREHQRGFAFCGSHSCRLWPSQRTELSLWFKSTLVCFYYLLLFLFIIFMLDVFCSCPFTFFPLRYIKLYICLSFSVSLLLCKSKYFSNLEFAFLHLCFLQKSITSQWR